MSENIPYIIAENGYYYVAYKEKVKVPELVVSSKGIANGLSEEYNDGWDFGPDSYSPTSTSAIPYTETSGIQEAGEYSYQKYGYTWVKLVGSVYNIYNTIYLHSEKLVMIEGIVGYNQSVLTTIQQNSVVPVFQNYGGERTISSHVFKDFVINLNIGTSTIKAMNFVNTTGFNIDSIYIDNVRFNTNNYGTVGNYSLYNDGAFFRVYYNNTGLGNANDFTLYTVNYEPYPSALWVYGGGYIGDIVASMRYVFMSNTNWYGNLTLTDTGQTPLHVDIHDLKYDPATTAAQTSLITVNTSVDSIDIHDISYLVSEDLSEIVELEGTSSTPITIGKLSIRNFRFVYNPAVSGSYTIGSAYTTSYATLIDYDIEPIIPNSSEIIMSPSYVSSTSGTTAGTVDMRFTEYASSHKKIIITFDGYENDTTTDQTIDFPMAFASYDGISLNTTGLTISPTTSGIVITAPDSTTTYSGIVIVEGY